MATGKDITELALLLKTERKANRKARRIEERARETAASLGGESVTAKDQSTEPERFADLFRPWTELKAPSDAELKLFRNSVGDATPLKQSARIANSAPKPSPHPKQREADEQNALEASQLAMYPSPMSWDIGADIEDDQSFIRAGINPDLLRKLRRGQWTIQAELDLHGHTQDDAHTAISEFVREARTADWRCVRIIHGKGLSSHQKIPVLRSKVRRWLQLKDEVLAYCEPRPNGGGSGAILVLLRGAR
ncbi:MAG: DNA mismatch repair protein MutS [Betaproteobacteria bacterium]|nr:MAG: DNA mismatch repair protein MutS [Betaproteobacteria bacterium]